MSEIKPGILAIGVGPDVGGMMFEISERTELINRFTGELMTAWKCVCMQDTQSYFEGIPAGIVAAGDVGIVSEAALRPLRGPTEQITTTNLPR